MTDSISTRKKQELAAWEAGITDRGKQQVHSIIQEAEEISTAECSGQRSIINTEIFQFSIAIPSSTKLSTLTVGILKNKTHQGFPGSPVVKTPPCNVEDTV